jgi:hypothetical protein
MWVFWSTRTEYLLGRIQWWAAQHVSIEPMSLGDLTKQLAVQALSSPSKPAAPAAPETPAAVVLGQLQAMQKALKDDEELLVQVHTGREMIRVLEIFLPSWQVAVLSGVDPEGKTTRVIAPAERVQLVCKVLKVAAGAKPHRLGLVAPRSKPE